jgi:hypothetical protein
MLTDVLLITFRTENNVLIWALKVVCVYVIHTDGNAAVRTRPCGGLIAKVANDRSKDISNGSFIAFY